MSAPLGIFVDNTNPSGSDSWALVLNGVVGNVQIGTFADMQAIQSSWDYLVDITEGGQTAGIGFTYDSINDTFAPPAPTLDVAKATMITQFTSDFNDYVTSFYDQPTQLAFLLAQFLAKQNLDIPKQTYIAPLLTWLYTVNVYFGTTISSIQALNNVGAVQAFSYNIAGSTGAVPDVTLAAMSQLP